MHGLRSPAGLAALTVGALALLCIPVVAFAKGPPQDPGGGQNPAGEKQPEAQAPVSGPKAAPPGQAMREPSGQTKPAPSGQAKGRAQAPASADDGPAARAPGQTGGVHRSRGDDRPVVGQARP